MPFDLKNALQIYQRLIDNALYKYLKIGIRPTILASGSLDLIDVFTDGKPDSDMKASVLGRRSCIDDILIPAKSWGYLYRKVERLLDVRNRWNLSISLANSFWGRRKVEYMAQQASLAGLEANSKILRSLVNISFTRSR